MRPELLVILIVEAFESRAFDGAVHPLHLAISGRVIGLCQPVLNTMRIADHVETHGAGVNLISVPRPICELDPIIGEYVMDPEGTALRRSSRNFQAVSRSALSTSWISANLLVLSMPTKRYSLPSAVYTSAMSMWKNPVG